ncbi:hypothetical protein MRX96_026316 [Rhipicephalus microplus]
MRIVIAMLQVLCFVVSYCFTGGYISFLNLPLYEEALDTVDKVLTAFTDGRLEPCIWKNSFVNVSLANPKSVLMSRLRDSVADWTPFMLEDMDECAERTRRRQAVFIEGILYQKRYAYSMRGQVQVSTDSLHDFMFMCYVLPKASPYEDLIQNATQAALTAKEERGEVREAFPHSVRGPRKSGSQHTGAGLLEGTLLRPLVKFFGGLGGFARDVRGAVLVPLQHAQNVVRCVCVAACEGLAEGSGPALAWPGAVQSEAEVGPEVDRGDTPGQEELRPGSRFERRGWALDEPESSVHPLRRPHPFARLFVRVRNNL